MVADSEQRPVRLLLVEDSDDDAELILLALRAGQLDFQSLCVSSEAELYNALAQQEWDLVLTDFNLLTLSAHEVVSVVRADPRDIPVIVVSGYIGEEEAVSLMKGGASDFVPKHNLARLLPAVEREIREAEVRRSERQALRALQEQERFLRDITSALGEGIVVMDHRWKVIYMNPEAERLLGWTEAELLGKPMHESVHYLKPDGSIHPAHECPITHLRQDGDRCQIEDDVYVRKDGSLLPISYVATRITDQNGAIQYVNAFQDRTARKQAEEELQASRQQLRELNAFLQRVREKERTHIARELHDELGQVLSGLHMDVDWLKRRLPAEDGPEAGKIVAMTELIDSALGTVRRISTDLRPAVLDDLGLEAAVEWLIDGLHSRTGIACQLQFDLDDGLLEEPIATAAFRLVQESLTNIVRHAQASQVQVSLGVADGELRLLVRDNGVGFDVDTHRPSSFGLLGMRERVLALNGGFQVDSQPGAGTSVIVSIPLDAPPVTDISLH